MKYMTDTSYFSPSIVLAIGAHADDIDFGASGSVARWAAEGAEVHYLVITDGSKGSSDPTMSPDELIDTRQAEQRTAAAILGAKQVHFLGYEDGMLEISLQLKKDIVRVIRQVRPDTVVMMDPTMIYSSALGFINHPDHRAATQAAMDAIFPLARDHMSFPELFQDEKLEPHKVGHVLLINLETQNYYVDISQHFDTKLAGLQKHSSQIPEDFSELQTMLTDRAATAGAKVGVRYAESFVRIDVRG